MPRGSPLVSIFLLAVAVALLLPGAAHAYSWNFAADPQQCANLSIQVTGSEGKPPYRVLIIPFGASPFSSDVEIRHIIDMTFPDNANSVSFLLPYPANSQLVAVVSDASGFGSGGTSVAAQVISSDDSSCFNASTNVQPDFVFSLNPPNQVVQCQDMRISWDPTTVQGNPTFAGVIPGGRSFAIAPGPITTISEEGTGFTWTPNIRGGTTLLIVGGDNRGNGTGGSTLSTVSAGINNNITCLGNDSPSSTPGSPAGGSYPTNSNGSGVGGWGPGSSKNNVGAVIGGVIGGVTGIVLLVSLFLICRRRERQQKSKKERPVNLLMDGDEDGDEGHEGLPQHFQPEPFVVPDPTASSLTEVIQSQGRPLSGTSTSMTSNGTSPDAFVQTGMSSTAATRKSGNRIMRPVNIIQHEDAGPRKVEEEGGAETVELPPAYTMVGKGKQEDGAAYMMVRAESDEENNRPQRVADASHQNEAST